MRKSLFEIFNPEWSPGPQKAIAVSISSQADPPKRTTWNAAAPRESLSCLIYAALMPFRAGFPKGNLFLLKF
jgi:hypothetical protein